MNPYETDEVEIADLDIARLSDEEVLFLADLKLSAEQDERLIYLVSTGKTMELSQAEQIELLGLIQISQLGLLRKAQGLAEAVRRGIREPRHPQPI